MDSKQYLRDSARTVPEDYKGIAKRMTASQEIIDLIHSKDGLAGEVGEFVDAIKKHLYYGADLDVVNLKEELGDMLWYIALAMRALDTDFEIEMKRNIDKLKARFAEKFTVEEVSNRDLDKERKLLEA